MLSRFFATLLVIMLSTKSFGFVLDIDRHHQTGDDAHAYFHSVGQPHAHESNERESSRMTAVLDYSEEAVNHVNSDYDLASIYVFEIPRSIQYHSTAGKAFVTPLPDWQTPFLEYSPPPPKVS